MDMSGTKELEKFRAEWKRELQHPREREGELDLSHIAVTSSSGSNEAGVGVIKDVDSQAQGSRGNDKSLHISTSGNLELIQFMDDTSQDALEIEGDSSSSTKINNVPDTGEYYPFKILTQFLNEAPRKVKTKKRAPKANTSEVSYAKRRYFMNESLHTQTVSKEQETKQTPLTMEHRQTEKMLDLFLADLDEINEIPFFDSTLPREVAVKIFQHLDMESLCSCSMVSRSWRSLADDEILWWNVCHSLGYDTDLHVSDVEGWKAKVRRHVEQRRLLNANWRARVGKPYHLNFARGGILCAVESCGSSIVAGYTSCNVRSWDTKSGDVCTFNASNTALVVDENTDDWGLIRNEIKQVSMTSHVTAASFRHGFVDVWSNDGGTDPIHTFTFRNPDVMSLTAQDVSGGCSVVAASQNTRVQISGIREQEGHGIYDFDMREKVKQLVWFSSCHSSKSPRLLITSQNSVHLKTVDLSSLWSGNESKLDQDALEVHNIIWAPITCIGLRSPADEVAVGFNLYTGPSTQVKVNIYDLIKNHLKTTLSGHTWLITSIHMPDTQTDQLVTGSGDRKVRLYDTRVGSFASMNLIGHASKVTAVQMDDWKVASGDEGGFVYVWDQRMGRKLWDVHNRHPVHYCHFNERLLIIGNVPYQKFPEQDEFETLSSLRYRGTVQVYDFLANQQTQGIPDICLSSYNEPEAYDYNIGLAVPYDTVS